jgi:D-alanine transaminase
MARLAYVNGQYVPHSVAAVHVEDRGYQFGDGVYEVVSVVKCRLIDLEGHLDRLERSLSELRINWPVKRQVLVILMRQLLVRNGVADGLIYIQVTRGVAPRDHKFPKNVKPSLVMTTKKVVHENSPRFANGVKVVTIPDIRWVRCDIKSTSLLPNCLGKQTAAEAGAYEAWQVNDNGYITEGTSSNAWIISENGELITRAPTSEILNGITRLTILKIATELGVAFTERPFSVEEAKSSREAFTTSATSFVTPVVQIDNTAIGDGVPGALTRKLTDQYHTYIDALATL